MSTFRRTAFTLIELLVVIAIIGILSGLIVVSMSGVTNKASIAKAQVFSNSLRNTLMLNLISEWKFDGTTSAGSLATNNDVLDTWGVYNYNGNITGHAPTVRSGNDCVRNNCLDFDGSTMYISYGNILIPDSVNNRTMEVWVYPHSQSSNTIFSTGNLWTSKSGYSIFTISSASTIKVSYNFNITPYTADISCSTDLNKWNYLVFNIDVSDPTNTTIKIYKNGNYVSQTTQVRASGSSSTAFLIGAETNGSLGAPINFFNGLIDEVRVYNASMPASQIKEQYYLGLNKLLISNQINTKEYNERINLIAKQ